MSDGTNSFEARLARLETQVHMLDRLVNERIAAVDRATELQAGEYARRLAELNHAHQQALQDRGSFLLRDVWEAWRNELETWRKNVADELAETRGKTLGWMLAVGIGVTGLNILIRFLKV